MQFKDYVYKRVDMTQLKDDFETQLSAMADATDMGAMDKAIKEIYVLRNHFETMATVASVRFSIDMTDEFYLGENNFYDQAGPIVEGYVSRFYKALAASELSGEIEAKYGRHLMNIAKVTVKTFADEILEDLQEENKTVTEYSMLIGTAKIDFRGETYNISTMSPFVRSKDRETRIEAQKAVTSFFEANEAKLDDLYDKLVKIRHGMAKKLGYDNFVQLGYDRLTRTDYGPNEVAKFREQVLEHVVPLKSALHKRQAKRLGLDHLYYYDGPLAFLSGNPKPAGDEAWMVEKASHMYKELSPETHEFFSFMTEKGLLDLTSRDGKRQGGYCTYMPDYRSPFIFANFNGTAHDVTVLTHEAGHAFQVYASRDYDVAEYQWPTLEACEIHSMSMEYLTYPWMEDFFEEDREKFVFSHSSEPIEFIPYGVTVDEFQHWIYEHPEATPDERKLAWRDTEKKYLPDKDYADNDFLEKGGFWYRQGHIYRTPFYYIDYTLAMTCAAQFYMKSLDDREKAWDDYVKLCKAGGSMPFTELIKVANVQNPFEEGTVGRVVKVVQELLDSIDDTKL